MNLKIKDFGVIKNADIKVDGITVITGNNNTGKSTIGKVFFSYFNKFPWFIGISFFSSILFFKLLFLK